MNRGRVLAIERSLIRAKPCMGACYTAASEGIYRFPKRTRKGNNMDAKDIVTDEAGRPDLSGLTPEELIDGTSSMAPIAEVVPVEEPAPMAPIDPDSVDDFFKDVADPEGRSFNMGKASTSDEGAPIDDVSQSFTALKESISQGRELKAREKEHDALVEQLDADRAELADRDNILANYYDLLAEQDAIIDQATLEKNNCKENMAEANDRLQAATEALERMKALHAEQLSPLETALGQARAAADLAKNDERSRKSELSAAETELKRAEEGQSEIAAAKQRIVSEAYTAAKAYAEQTKAELADAEKAYDVAKRRCDGEKAPLEKSIEELESAIAVLKGKVSELDTTLDAANTRRQRIEDVYRNPGETEQLRSDIAADEETERKMIEENDKLRVKLEESKDKAFKAKIVVGAIAAVLILIIILLVVFL